MPTMSSAGWRIWKRICNKRSRGRTDKHKAPPYREFAGNARCPLFAALKVAHHLHMGWRSDDVAHAIADHDDLGINRKVQLGQSYHPFLAAAVARAIASW